MWSRDALSAAPAPRISARLGSRCTPTPSRAPMILAVWCDRRAGELNSVGCLTRAPSLAAAACAWRTPRGLNGGSGCTLLTAGDGWPWRTKKTRVTCARIPLYSPAHAPPAPSDAFNLIAALQNGNRRGPLAAGRPSGTRSRQRVCLVPSRRHGTPTQPQGRGPCLP